MPRRATPLSVLLKQMVSEPLSQYSDRLLLARFAADGDEKAFAAIVDRHSAMLLALCRRQLGDAHLAEDVLQATFLVLARKARSIRRQESLADWLYGVAQRLARQSRLASSSRWRREQRAAAQRGQDAGADPGWEALLQVLDEELQRLPERYRSPLLLCYLEGRTQDEAAKQLGLGLNTLRRRLEHGRGLLRLRMTARGATLGAGLVAGFLAPSAARAAVTAELRRAVVAMARVGSKGIVASTSVMALASGAMRMSMIVRIIIWVSAALAATGLAAGVAWQLELGAQVIEPRPGQIQPDKKPVLVVAGDQAKAPAPGRDLFGDTLPEGALARLGTVVFRHGPIRGIGTVSLSSTRRIVGPDGNPPRFVSNFAYVPSYRESSLTFTADGKHLVSTGGGWLKRWDLATGHPTFTAGDGGEKDAWTAREVFITAAGGKLAHGCSVGVEVVTNPLRFTTYDLEAGTARSHVLDFPEKPPQAVVLPQFVSPDGKFLVAIQASHLTVWNAADGSFVRQIGVQPAKAKRYNKALAFTPDARSVIVSEVSGDIRVFELATGTLLRSFGPDKNGGGDLMAISPDGKWLATNSGRPVPGKQPPGSALSLWDFTDGKLLHTIEVPKGAIHTLLFTPDSSTLIAGVSGGGPFSPAASIRTWDVASGKPGRAWTDDPTIGAIPVVSPDGNTMATLSEDGVIRLWEMRSGKEVRSPAASACSISEVFFRPDGKTIWTLGIDGALGQWDAATGKLLAPLRTLTKGAHSRFLAGGDFLEVQLLLDAADSQLIDVASGKVVLQASQAALVVSPDKTRAALFQRDLKAPGPSLGSISIVDIKTGKIVQTLEESGKALSLSPGYFTADGRSLVMAGSWLTVWDVQSGKVKSAVLRPKVEVDPGNQKQRSQSVVTAISPDGSKTAFAFSHRVVGGPVTELRHLSGDILIIDTATGKPLQQMHIERDLKMQALTFSPDGKHLAMGGFGTVRVWELGRDKAVHEFKGHRGQVTSLAFSANGKHLASAGEDSTVLLWNVAK
jgi:RNA polymerase sigma factor (sigma-70 family)